MSENLDKVIENYSKSEKQYYPNGKLKSKNQLDGDYRYYYENGQLAVENFEMVTLGTGCFVNIERMGTIKHEQNYKEGILLNKTVSPLNDVLKLYNDNGKLVDEAPYKNGKRRWNF